MVAGADSDSAAADGIADSGSPSPALCGQDAGPVALAAGMAEAASEELGRTVKVEAAVEVGNDVWLHSCPLVVRSMPDDWSRINSACLRPVDWGELPRPNCFTSSPSYWGL